MKVLKKTSSVVCLMGAALITQAAFAETVTVTNLDSSGIGSLAAAIAAANADPSLTNIVFDIDGGGLLEPKSTSFITTPVEINGANAGAQVTLIGTLPRGPGAPNSGLYFDAGSEGSKIRNLQTNGFLNAVYVNANNVSIQDSQFAEPLSHSVVYDSAVGGLIQNSQFQDESGFGIRLENSKNIGVIGNTFQAGGVLVQSSDSITVGATGANQGNTFDGSFASTSPAVLVSGNSNSIRVMGNSISNQAQEGVVVQTASNSFVAFNDFFNNLKEDVVIAGGTDAEVSRNTITGDAIALEAGITILSTPNAKIIGNTLDGARITLNGTDGAIVGGIFSDGNILKNDPQGFSGNAAIILNSAENSNVVNNTIVENASNGILLNNSSNNTVYANNISNNNRTAIKVLGGVENTLSANVMLGQQASAQGDTNSIALLGNANANIVAPVITSVIPSAANPNELEISGTAAAGDRIEIFASSTSDNGIDALTDTAVYITEAYAVNDGHWSATVLAHLLDNPTNPSFTVTATDAAGNTSALSSNEGISELQAGINGPATVNVGEGVYYQVEEIAGVSYQWWLNGNAVIQGGNGSASIGARFYTAGSTVTVSVGYSHPTKGWVQENFNVEVK